VEVSDLRKEIEKCLKLSYRIGQFSHCEIYKNNIGVLDEMMASYFGKYYNEETGEYE